MMAGTGCATVLRSHHREDIEDNDIITIETSSIAQLTHSPSPTALKTYYSVKDFNDRVANRLFLVYLAL